MPAARILRRLLALASVLLPLASAAQPAAPLVAAAGRGDLAAVRRLAEAGAPIEQRDERGRTPLLAATDGDHLEVSRPASAGTWTPCSCC